MAAAGVFVSVWDDGAFAIESPCEVDLRKMEVIEMFEDRMAWDEDGNAVYDENEIDVLINTVEHLDEEYVLLDDGTRYTAAREDDDEAEDYYGNGIIYYPQ